MPMPKNQVLLICKECGKEFSVKASQSRQQCCTWACKKASDARKHETRNCLHCGKPFATYVSNPRKYCSISCGVSARNLTDQNPSYHRDVSGEKNPMYGVSRYGPDNPMYGRTGPSNPSWKGGRKTRADGYVLVMAPSDHPIRITNVEPFILEHRLIMEQHLGRYLDPEEVVHHIDGDPSNNGIDNLQLFASQSDHISIGHGNG